MKTKCDVCESKKKSEKLNHFSGWIHGEFNKDISICNKCVSKFAYQHYFIAVPDAHLKGE